MRRTENLVYSETPAIARARRSLLLFEDVFYRALTHDVSRMTDLESRYRRVANASRSTADQRSLLATFQSTATADIRRRRTRIDFLLQFRPLKRLPEGERGRSWIVDDRIVDLRVTMKTYRRSDVDDDWLKSIGQLVGLDHPHVCQLRAVFMPRENGRLLCLMSEFCLGGSLAVLLRSLHPSDRIEYPNRVRFRVRAEAAAVKAKTDEPARFVLTEMIAGLLHLHDLGVGHGCLKPENVLLTDQGHVKISDFVLTGEVNRSRLQAWFKFVERQDGGFVEALTSPWIRMRSWTGRSIDRVDWEMSGCRHSVVLPRVDVQDEFAAFVLFSPPEALSSRTWRRQDADMWAVGVLAFMMYCGGNPFDRMCQYAPRGSILMQRIGHVLRFKDNHFLRPEFVGEFAPRDAVSLIGGLIAEQEDRIDDRGVRGHKLFRGVDLKASERRSPIRMGVKEDLWMSEEDWRVWRRNVGIGVAGDDRRREVDLLDEVADSSELHNDILMYMGV